MMRDLGSGVDLARRAGGNRRDSRTNERRLVADMLGRELDTLYPRESSGQAARALASRNLSGKIASDVASRSHQGEIVGLTGLLGMGHDEIPYLLFGGQARSAARSSVDNRPLAELTPREAMQAGMAFLPADRQRQSGIPRRPCSRMSR